MPEQIDYAQIDCEIRTLVELVNSFPGIKTHFSCAGHGDGQDAYVSFTAESQDCLEGFLRALPFIEARMSVVRNQLQTQSVFVDTSLNSVGRIWYRLILSGSPEYIQRRLIADVEKALISALDRLGAKRPSCPKCVSHRSEDTGLLRSV